MPAASGARCPFVFQPHSTPPMHTHLTPHPYINILRSFTPSTKVYSSCTGPSITMALVPKVCVLDAVNHAVVCDPPKLVLNKNPGSCTHEYYSASSWVGKEVRQEGTGVRRCL